MVVIIVCLRFVPRKHSTNEESSVPSRAAAAVTFIIAKCFSVESPECPKRDNALAAASSLPLLTSHHGDPFEIRKIGLEIGGTDSGINDATRTDVMPKPHCATKRPQ